MIDGLVRIPMRRFADERGWFAEIRRESALPKPTAQTNVSFSRRGVIRGLHYHERGQDDLRPDSGGITHRDRDRAPSHPSPHRGA